MYLVLIGIVYGIIGSCLYTKYYKQNILLQCLKWAYFWPIFTMEKIKGLKNG